MTEKRISDAADIVRINSDVKKAADRAKTANDAAADAAANISCDAVEKIYEKACEEVNGNDMNTQENQQIAQTEWSAEWSLEKEELLEQLLDEIAREDEAVVVPLEVQAAWRSAIRAEAASRSEHRGSGKIIRMNRWIRSVGSIAAALVVLFTGTWGIRLAERDAVLPADNPSENVMYTAEYASDDGAESAPKNGIVTMGGSYVQLGSVGLRSDGKDDGSDEAASAQVQTANTESTSAPVVIRSAQRSIQSKEYDRDMQWLGDLVIEYGAYYEEKSETTASEHQSGRVSTMMIRVPVERLDDFLTEMDQLGVTVMRSEKAEEVTYRYMDTQSRLDALYRQRDTLSGMMTNAQSVQEVIAIDARLNEVLSEIERLEGDMIRWENQQSYSTVKVTMTETFEQPLTSEASLGQRVKAGFDESVAWLKEFGQDALVLLAAFLPRAVLFIPAAVLLGVLIRMFVRKRRG